MCCVECFADTWLRDYVMRQSASVGDCVHCRREAVPLIDAILLRPEFEKVLEAYSPRANGMELGALLQEDWQLFAIDGVERSRLLVEILGGPAGVLYGARAFPGAESATANWTALKEELKSTNRFFPRNAPDRARFTDLINNLVRTDIPRPLYRARVLKNTDSYPADQMGAPPAHVASDGRANPIGIPYLYLAEDVETAIGEVRPAKHDRVAVARFAPAEGRELKLVDLSNPRGTVSPFAINVENIGEVRSSMDFLCLLGDELSTPTLPHRASIDYLASQYLCELIKNIGYDGVIYSSAQTGRLNVTLFDPHNAEVDELVTVYKIENLTLSIVEEIQVHRGA